MKWAFADFDDLGVEADKRTLTPEDFAKVMDLLKFPAHATLHVFEGTGGS